MNTLHSCKITRFFVFVVCSTISSIAQSYQKFSPALDIYLDGLPHRRFHNVSLGIDPDENIGHHCNISNNESTGRKDMKFTPNRRLQEETISDAVEGSLQLGVVLAVGGHNGDHGNYNYGSEGSVNGLLAVWDSWLQYFFSVSSNTTSLLLFFDERDFNASNSKRLADSNAQRSRKEYLDHILINNMGAEPVDCIHLRNRTHHRSKGRAQSASYKRSAMRPGHTQGCSNELNIDQGYRVYYIDVAAKVSNISIDQKPFIIFASIYRFPMPKWALSDIASGKLKDEETLFKTWKPFRLNRRYPTNYAYVKMTNWYAYYMLQLRLLDFFDYAGKLDNDVSFVSPFPEPNLPKRLALNGTYMMATQKGWYYDDPRISQGVLYCLQSFVENEMKRCRQGKDGKTEKSKKEDTIQLTPRGMRDMHFWESSLNVTFRAHFLTYWLGLYTAPEVCYAILSFFGSLVLALAFSYKTKVLAKHWNELHPYGMWDFRWGDQQWWPRPISMFGEGNLNKEIDHYDEINTDNEKYLIHKLWPRQATIAKVQYYNSSDGIHLKEERDLLYKKAAKAFGQ